jgi:hypothetical protein
MHKIGLGLYWCNLSEFVWKPEKKQENHHQSGCLRANTHYNYRIIVDGRYRTLEL